MQSTTFVTSFLKIDGDSIKKMSWRYEKFIEIANSGIQICVYIDKSMAELFIDIELYPNVKIMNTEISLEETFPFKVCQNKDILIPKFLNKTKDTINYMLLMNSKIDFMHKAIEKNPWNTKYFAWIDFSISHIFKDINNCTEQLKLLGNIKTNKRFLAIPGCYDAISSDEDYLILSKIFWRFCGGFFIGDIESIEDFFHLSREFFPLFIEKNKTLVWEVNFWSWLEANSSWKPNWYLADHNDSIINIPSEYFLTCIHDLAIKQIYLYPIINEFSEQGKFIPGSASYLKYDGKHFLNTRYVNYTIKDKKFKIHHPNGYVITKNVLSTLDDNLIPIDYKEIEDPPKDNNMIMFNGIEDVRLYEYLNEIHFVATSMSHSTQGRNLIVTGKYEGNKMTDCHMIEPPNKSTCEKNWTPIIQSIDGIENEYFIYKWFPLQIGKIRENKLEIEIIHDIEYPIFKKFRGSTIFSEWGEFLIGVVHYSEGERLDRKYFHVLVMLNAKTLRPVKVSNSFYFGKEPGIEFCIGFTIINTKYEFWISQLDSNPIHYTVDMINIPFCFDV